MAEFLLDADETVLDFVRSSKESLAGALQAFGLPYREEMYGAYKRINDELWRAYERGEVDKKRLMQERFSRFLSLYGSGADAAAVNAVYFDTLCKTGYLLEGARERLSALQGRGRVVHVANGTPAAR